MKDTCGRFKLFVTLTFYSSVTSAILCCNLNIMDSHFAKYEQPLSINVLKVVKQVYVYLPLTFDAKIYFL